MGQNVLACANDAKAAIRKISKHILLFEYDEAFTLIDRLLRGAMQ